MKISHIALYTNDLEIMKNYYEQYFSAKSNQKYHNPITGLETYFLSFADGTRLEIMTRPNLSDHESPPLHIGWAHLAFSTGSKEGVDTLTQQLLSDGYTVFSGPRVTGDGYYESCVSDPEGNQIELLI